MSVAWQKIQALAWIYRSFAKYGRSLSFILLIIKFFEVITEIFYVSRYTVVTLLKI